MIQYGGWYYFQITLLGAHGIGAVIRLILCTGYQPGMAKRLANSGPSPESA